MKSRFGKEQSLTGRGYCIAGGSRNFQQHVFRIRFYQNPGIFSDRDIFRNGYHLETPCRLLQKFERSQDIREHGLRRLGYEGKVEDSAAPDPPGQWDIEIGDIRCAVENIAFDGLVPALVTGKIDMIMSSMTITDARRQTVDFSEPYANAMLALLTKKDASIKSIDDLNASGRTLAVKIGSTGHLYAQKHLTKATVTALADESACVMEVASGKADGFIYDQLTIYRNQQKNPETTQALFIPFQNVEPWGVAVRKGDTKLKEALDKFIADYRADKGFEKLTEKHLADEKAAFDKLGFTWFFDMKPAK